MKSRTIGSGGDDADIPTWEAQINDSDSETGTCIESANLANGGATLDASLTGGRTALLTANAGNAVAAPTYAAMTGKARISKAGGPALSIAATGFTVEKLGIVCTVDNSNAVETTATTAVRRCVTQGNGTASGMVIFSGTATVSNCVALAANNGFASAGGTLNLYHSSAAGQAANGILNAAGTLNAYACIVQGTPFGGCFVGTIGGDYNVSQDATAPASGATKYARNESGWFTSIVATSEDLSLVVGKQGWWAANKDAINQSGWPADVGTDIVGTTRTAPIDPGVWQTPAGGGTIPTLTYAPFSSGCEEAAGPITPDYGDGDHPTSCARTGGDTFPASHTLNNDGTVTIDESLGVVGDIGDYDVIISATNATGTQTNIHIPFSVTANPPQGSWATPFDKKCAYASSTAAFNHTGGSAPDTFSLSEALGGLAINAGTGLLTFDPDLSEGIPPTGRTINFESPGGQVGSAPISVEFHYEFTARVNGAVDVPEVWRVRSGSGVVGEGTIILGGKTFGLLVLDDPGIRHTFTLGGAVR